MTTPIDTPVCCPSCGAAISALTPKVLSDITGISVDTIRAWSSRAVFTPNYLKGGNARGKGTWRRYERSDAIAAVLVRTLSNIGVNPVDAREIVLGALKAAKDGYYYLLVWHDEEGDRRVEIFSDRLSALESCSSTGSLIHLGEMLEALNRRAALHGIAPFSFDEVATQ